MLSHNIATRTLASILQSCQFRSWPVCHFWRQEAQHQVTPSSSPNGCHYLQMYYLLFLHATLGQGRILNSYNDFFTGIFLKAYCCVTASEIIWCLKPSKFRLWLRKEFWENCRRSVQSGPQLVTVLWLCYNSNHSYCWDPVLVISELRVTSTI